MASAASCSIKAQSPARIARAVSETIAKVSGATAGLVFVSGSLATQLNELAAALGELDAKIPLLLVCGTGVLTDKGEIEDQPAAAILVWSGGRAEPFAVEAGDAEELGEALARIIADRAARTAPTVIAFVRPEGFSPQVLEQLQEIRGARHLIGGGSAAGAPLFAIHGTRVTSGAAVALVLRGVLPPAVRSSPACRLLMPLRRITECRGSMVVRLDDEAALDVLSEVGKDLTDQPLVFAVLAAEDSAPTTSRPELLVRAVQGVDPVRRGLLVSDEVREGMRLAFAVRDPVAARTDLETAVRDLGREIAGSLPRFMLYVNCAGRGSSLYGQYDVDTRILRARFGDVPFAGIQSSFEIAPYAGRPALQLYTGVVAVFTTPS
jgi:small ligand-binding sensory domain FIST